MLNYFIIIPAVSSLIGRHAETVARLLKHREITRAWPGSRFSELAGGGVCVCLGGGLLRIQASLARVVNSLLGSLV